MWVGMQARLGVVAVAVVVVCVEFSVRLHVGGMLFEIALSESCFLTALCSSKEALGLG